MNPSKRPAGGRRRQPGRTPKRSPRGESVEPLHPMETPPDIASFSEWDLDPDVLRSIADMGITKPTPIQALAIGPALAGRDVIAKAETGTGKTLAFGAPMMSRIDPGRKSVLALVLCPTRELSEQVFKVLEELGRARGLKVALIVGGEPLNPQVKALQAGSQVVVATPGRVLDLMGQGFLTFPWTEFAVLDEADKMLEIGFIDDVKKILEACDEDVRQTMCFSATFPAPLLRLARSHTRDPVEVATAAGLSTVDTITQYFLEVTEEGRPRSLADLIRSSADDAVFLVFCDRRTEVDRLTRRMERERFLVKALHGGYDQPSRFRVMDAFRTGDVKCLVATDVASRGLDVLHVTHVVNFGPPRDAMDYTHRIGRTGRAGRQGTAVTLVGPSDRRGWRAMQRHLPFEIHELESSRTLAGRDRRLRDDFPPPESPAGSRRRRDESRHAGRQEPPAPSADEPARERPGVAPKAPAPAAADRAASTAFGLGVNGAPTPAEARETRRPQPAPPGEERTPEPAPDEAPEAQDSAAESTSGSSGFGAGL